jgi:hypothetical protein
LRRRGAGDSELRFETDDSDLKPSAMRGSEPLYGYVVALELVVIAIINLTDTHGKGAPVHPDRVLSIVGLVASAGIVGVIAGTRNRFFVGFYAMAAAFLVTTPKVPDSLELTHLLAIAMPVVYALILTQRQNRARLAQAKSRRVATPGRAPAKGKTTAAERRAELQARRRQGQGRRRDANEPTGPARSRRYTPPKPKRKIR